MTNPPAERRHIRFTKRAIPLQRAGSAQVLALEPLPSHPAGAIAYDEERVLFFVDLESGHCRDIAKITEDQVPSAGDLSMVVSKDNAFVAITAAGSTDAGDSFNSGVVVELASGACIMPLNCGDYRVHHAPFPVGFVVRDGKTLVIHATDWNRMDVTDPRTGVCLTEREPLAESEEENLLESSVFTEWSGTLKVSPDQSRVATIGWAWHPVGIAYSWSMAPWLEGNAWESDHGKSKRSYAMWSYFWFSPFFWYDERTLCIWGDPDVDNNADSPSNNVVFYDAESEERLRSFEGPTMEGFHFDKYLFTGIPDNGGVTVWDLESGSLLHEESGVPGKYYHPGRREFIDVSPDGWCAWQWEES